MNTEALVAVGMFTVVLGIILIVPGMLLGRHLAKKHPDAPRARIVTRAGYMAGFVIVVILLGGYSIPYWSPGSVPGKLMSMRGGQTLFALIVMIGAGIADRILAHNGILLLRPRNPP